MSLSLSEYADSLDQRDLIWPKVPAPKPVNAKPAIDPLPGVKAVLWDVYGTLLRTPDCGFTLFPEQEVRLQVALEKTIHEFNMWISMYRKPGPPWQSMINQYRDYAERLAMVGTKHRGDITDVNLVHIWQAVVDRLFDKEYTYDEGELGDVEDLSEKIAFFFHRCLQAIEARPGLSDALTQLHEAGIKQGVLADGQPFTMVQLARSLAEEGSPPPLFRLFPSAHNLLSYQMGIRKPSPSLYKQAAGQLAAHGIEPSEILHVSCRLKTDLAPAKAAGMKTALLAAEKTGLEATANMIKDPQTRPDRLLTDVTQITSVIGFG
ncbi:HAD family hydrolase [Fuerstiella marisgermanici]|uniref:HAD hydrolase n=1 Tax=Fuerstiella marisgermanici TaxID=1891926 RepID=A0A1P8WN16_9PLAN|nr:HAD family hydrolase [Fuerstiella marisgermanici]APZ95427.1 HAD hydrolase [Fuerstiella marisgermanici]